MNLNIRKKRGITETDEKEKKNDSRESSARPEIVFCRRLYRAFFTTHHAGPPWHYKLIYIPSVSVTPAFFKKRSVHTCKHNCKHGVGDNV